MHLIRPCPTRWAVLLLGIPDANGILHFPTAHSWLPGLHFQPGHKAPLVDQLWAVISEELGEQLPWKDAEIFHDFCEPVHGEDRSIYAGRLLIPRVPKPAHWEQLPALLKRMPANRSRLACLKAWQILSGVHKEKIQAAETNQMI